MHFFKCSEMAVYSYLQLFEIIKAYFLFYILKELEFDLCVCWVIHRKFSGWIFSKIERDQVKVLRPILMPLWKFYLRNWSYLHAVSWFVVLRCLSLFLYNFLPLFDNFMGKLWNWTSKMDQHWKHKYNLITTLH